MLPTALKTLGKKCKKSPLVVRNIVPGKPGTTKPTSLVMTAAINGQALSLV